jgi:hypothetical protein
MRSAWALAVGCAVVTLCGCGSGAKKTPVVDRPSLGFAASANRACAPLRVVLAQYTARSRNLVVGSSAADREIAKGLRDEVLTRSRELSALSRVRPPREDAASLARYIALGKKLNGLDRRFIKLNAQASAGLGAAKALAAMVRLAGVSNLARTEQRRLARRMALPSCEQAAG